MNFRKSSESFIYVDNLSNYKVTLDYSLISDKKFVCRYARPGHKYYALSSPSSSAIVTISVQSDCTKNLFGREDKSIVILNDSSLSNVSSSNIEILNDILVSPAGTVTLNGPGS